MPEKLASEDLTLSDSHEGKFFMRKKEMEVVMKDKIALQLYSVRWQLEEDFRGTLEKVKAMGYDGVEFAGIYGHDPLEIKAMCEEIGLVPISAHVPFDDLMKDTEAMMDCYSKIGCKHVVVPYLTEEYRPGTPGFAKVVAGIKDVIGVAAKKYGLVLQYHNHDFEFDKIDGEYALDILYKEVGPELLQTQLDTCWVNVGGENPADYVRKYAGRTPTVHLKDFKGSKSENMYELIGIDKEKGEDAGSFELRPLGKGVQDFKAIVAASKESGAQWFIVEQDNPSLGLDALECAKVSIDYLKSEIME